MFELIFKFIKNFFLELNHVVNKRDIGENSNANRNPKDHELLAKEQLDIKMKEAKNEHQHDHEEEKNFSHSSIGVTLVLGFVFMLLLSLIHI